MIKCFVTCNPIGPLNFYLEENSNIMTFRSRCFANKLEETATSLISTFNIQEFKVLCANEQYKNKIQQKLDKCLKSGGEKNEKTNS